MSEKQKTGAIGKKLPNEKNIKHCNNQIQNPQELQKLQKRVKTQNRSKFQLKELYMIQKVKKMLSQV